MHDADLAPSSLRASSLLRVVALSSLLCVSAALSQTQPATTQASLEALIARLSADEWRDREAATKALVALGPAALPRLKVIAEETTNEEVRSRSQSAIAQIGEAALIGPSVITMHLKNASAKDAFAELARQANAPPFRTQPANLFEASTPPSAEINLEGASYFAALAELFDKFNIRFVNTGDGLRLMQGRGAKAPGFMQSGPSQISGPFRIACSSMTRTQSIQFKEAGGDGDIKGTTNDQIYLHLSLFAEPKIAFASRNLNSTIEECVDDRGGKMKSSEQSGAYGSGGPILPVMIYLSSPSKDAMSIVRFAGTIEVPTVLRYERLEVTELASVKDKSQSAGGNTYTVKSFVSQANGYSVNLSIVSKGGDGMRDVYGRFNAETVELLDADGKALQGTASGGRSDMRSMETAMTFRKVTADGVATGEPVKLVWRLPSETRNIAVPFEFKNFPLPK